MLAVDLDDLESDIIRGKFKSKSDVAKHVAQTAQIERERITDLSAWKEIVEGLFEPARSLYAALPQQHGKYDSMVPTGPAREAMKNGKCENGHPVLDIRDLAPNGKGKLACHACRLERQRKRRK